MVANLVVGLAKSLTEAFVDLLPRLVGAAVLVAVAYPLIGLSTGYFERALIRSGRDESVAKLLRLVLQVFLLYSLALAVLAAVGFSGLATSLGTAVGFIGLGVSYALKDVIGEVVAGVYLIRDPDFESGDSVVTGDGSGTVEAIGLRKARIRTEEGDLLVVSNASVDKKWTKKR